MHMKHVIFSVVTVLCVICAVPLFAQSIEQAQAEYEMLVKQIGEVTKKMSQLQAGAQGEYDQLKSEFDKLTVDIAEKRKIMESDQETNLKISEVKKMYNDGLNSFKIQRYNDAITKFGSAIRMGNALGSPLVNDALKLSNYGLARVYYSQRNFTAMIEPLESVMDIDPNYYGALNMMGKSYERQGKTDEAIAAYKKSIEINNTNGNFLAYFNLGVAYFSKKDYAGAKAEFNNALSRNPDHANAYLYLGRTYFESKDYTNALNALTKSIELKENAYEPHFFLAQVYNRTGRYRNAIEAAESTMKYHRRKANFGGALIERGKAYASLGNNARALEDFNVASNDRQYKRNAEYEIEILTKFGGKGDSENQ